MNEEAPIDAQPRASGAKRLFSGSAGAWTAAATVVVVSLLSTLTLATPQRGNQGPQTLSEATGPEDAIETTDSTTAASGQPAAGQQTVAPGSASGKSYDCSKGQNAGATDVGVTSKEIRFAATVVKTGVAKAFLSEAEIGMEAIAQKVNRAGGICGRIIKIVYKDDGWRQDEGARIIQSFINEKKYFGLAVNPSSEGLEGAIKGNYIRNAGFPVIGADGMLISQYKDPWVWPVATSTSSVMHIMAQNAYERGARTFGIAWESNYRFGVEGHDAFVGAVKRLGGTVNSDVGVQGGKPSYKNEASQFIGDCGGVNSLSKCDFLAILLEPATADQWVRDGGLGDGITRPKIGIGGPQPLFLDNFAQNCGNRCANMWVWTSFKPPIPPFDTDSAVSTYKQDLGLISRTVDLNNPHVEGAYVGMQLLVEALKRMGPSPTRAGLKQILDAMVFDSGLAPPLTFKGTNHFSNVSAQAFQAIVNNNNFANWRYTQSGFIADKEVGKDI